METILGMVATAVLFAAIIGCCVIKLRLADSLSRHNDERRRQQRDSARQKSCRATVSHHSKNGGL
jgi:hypothetical protein